MMSDRELYKPEDIARIFKRPDPPPNPFPTTLKCSCSGTIVVRTYHKYFGDIGRRIIGPGGASQLTKVQACFCQNCGLMYDLQTIQERIKREAAESSPQSDV